MPVANRTITRIQDADDFSQFQNWPGGALLMTPDVVPADVTVPVGYTAIWNNMQVGGGETVEAAGLLVDPGWLAGSALNILTIGDSKTANGAWRHLLVDLLNATDTSGKRYFLHTAEGVARAGLQTAEAHLYLDTNLPAVSQPAHICTIDLGVNDFGDPLYAETYWKTEFRGVIDAVRSKWPDCQIYIATVWKRGAAVDINTLAGWVFNVIAEYATGVYWGMDERDWLEGGDDGVTNTLDGVHYSTAGQTAAANAWCAGILGA